MSTAVANVRLRRFRERQRAGLSVVACEINWLDHVDMLVGCGLLQRWDADDKAVVEQATSRLLRALAREHETRFDLRFLNGA